MSKPTPFDALLDIVYEIVYEVLRGRIPEIELDVKQEN